MVTKAGVEPSLTGGDGKKRFFTTQQVFALHHGDLEAERIGKTRAERIQLELANAKSKQELVESAAVGRVIEGVFVAVRQIIRQSSLSNIEKQETLKQLREINLDDILKTTFLDLEEAAPDEVGPVQPATAASNK